MQLGDAAGIVKQGTSMGGKPNVPAAEWKTIKTLLGCSVGYNISDKMLLFSLYLSRPVQTASRRREGNV